MNRRSTFALLAALGVCGALCAAVPQIVGEHADAPVVATAGSTQPAGTQQVAGTQPAPTSRPGPTSMPISAAQMREQAEQTRGPTAYIALFVILLLSGLGLPIPEEIPLLLAGYVARHGQASLYVLIPVGLTGVLIADIMLFLAARRWRSHIFRVRWIRATIKPRHLVLVRDQFHKHGMKIVIIARWLPALRTAVCLTAGLTGVSTLHFLLVDATAACITVPTSIFLGYFAANQIDRLISGFVRAEHTVLLVVLLAVAVLLFYWLVWGRHKHRQDKLAKPLPAQDVEEWETEDVLGPSSSRSDVSAQDEDR